jgi:hypothetical protein
VLDLRQNLAFADNMLNEIVQILIVPDLVSQLRDVVLMNVYLDLGNPRGPGFWDEGYMSKGREMERSVYE